MGRGPLLASGGVVEKSPSGLSPDKESSSNFSSSLPKIRNDRPGKKLLERKNGWRKILKA